MEYKGEIEGFPTEVVEKMLERQVEQGNKRNVSVFEGRSTSNRRNGGFDWHETKATHGEGEVFWEDVILEKKFYVFFDKYPKAKEEPQTEIVEDQKVDMSDVVKPLKQSPISFVESESKYSQAEIAAMAMQGILSNTGMMEDPTHVAQKSIAYANALIERLKVGY